MEVEAEFGSVQVNIGQGLIHSMNRAMSMLMDVHGAWQKQDPMEYYFICNSTQQSLCFGQVCSTGVPYVQVLMFIITAPSRRKPLMCCLC